MLEEVTIEDLDKVFHINVASVVWGIQAATAKLKELGHGAKSSMPLRRPAMLAMRVSAYTPHRNSRCVR